MKLSLAVLLRLNAASAKMLKKRLLNFSHVHRLVEWYDQRHSSILYGLEMVNGDYGSLKLLVDRLRAMNRVKDEIPQTQKKLHDRAECEGPKVPSAATK